MMAGKFFVFSFADVEVREREFSLMKAGEAVPVEPKAFRVLLLLLRNPQKLLSKEELLSAVWGDTAVSENSLARSIALLRRLLGDEARAPRFIETVATVGYRWVCKVEVREEASGEAEAPLKPPETFAAEKAGKSRMRWGWMLAGGAALAFGLGATVWYLLRPLPTPKITEYTQLTHDGRTKIVGGTDGIRVYFEQFSPSRIVQMGVKGGEIAPLRAETPKFDFALMDISADGSNALIQTFEMREGGPGQWIVPVLGGAPKKLEDGNGETFSPDGGSVVYSTPNGHIFTVRIDGTGKRELASIGVEGGGFRWSPDGKVIRFSTGEGLWEMSQDGTGVHRLLPDWKAGLPCCGDWTRDGRLFIFTSRGQIWALDERRGLFRQPSAVPVQLTNGPLQWGSLVPGKDGRTIFADGALPRGELSRIDLKTGSFASFLGGISAEFVTFSPDGKSVAYVTFPECVLWRADRDGSNRMQLTQPPDHVINPRWSPDSKEIVFGTDSPDGHDSIRRIAAADGAPLWLLSEESAPMHDPNWSPDGRKVLFAKSPGTFYERGKRDLRIVDLETRRVSIVPGSGGVWSPRWSPDGRYIVGLRGLTSTLPLFDCATQQWRTLPGDGDVQFPSFSRDGRFVYFLRYDNDQGVFRVPLAGGKVERVVDLTDWHLTGQFGYWISLDPSDGLLVLRNTGSDDIYALTLEER